MTVLGVAVVEGTATELNFTLAPVANEGPRGVTATTHAMPSTDGRNLSTTTNSSDSTRTQVVPEATSNSSPPVLPPEPQPVQPQEFRHHGYSDMQLFLRKYSSEFPSIAHLYSIGHSVENRELFVMAISDNPAVHEHGVCGLINGVGLLLCHLHVDLLTEMFIATSSFCFHGR